MSNEQHNTPAVAPTTRLAAAIAPTVTPSAAMWWDGGERAITAREKARIEEHGPSCFSIALVPATPAARWAADGQPDPHGNRYACERAALTLGNLTDDELANAVFLHGNEQPTMADLAAGKALAGIVYLTAAKERIRWLSRALVDATCKQPLQVGEVQGDAHAPVLRALRATLNESGRSSPARTAALDAAIAALAARQPGVHGWSGWATQKPGHMPKLWGTREIAELNHDLTGDARLIFLSEQPAQGIDLGQLRALAEQWKQLEYPFSYEGQQAQRAADAFRADLLALIDQRDAAPGVGS